MPTRVALTIPEGNDAVVAWTVTPDDPTEDLTSITELRLYIKADSCADDDDPATVVLRSTDPAQLQVTSFTPSEIRGLAYFPRLTGSYDRLWRLDGLTAAPKRRTALYGPIHVTDL